MFAGFNLLNFGGGEGGGSAYDRFLETIRLAKSRPKCSELSDLPQDCFAL